MPYSRLTSLTIMYVRSHDTAMTNHSKLSPSATWHACLQQHTCNLCHQRQAARSCPDLEQCLLLLHAAAPAHSRTGLQQDVACLQVTVTTGNKQKTA